MKKSSALYDLRSLLLPLNPLYYLGYRLDRFFKTRRQEHEPKAFVISVGNLSTGGTGKTPFVIWLAGKLNKRKPVILTRGYRSGVRPGLYKYGPGSSRFGDEPSLIAKKTGLAVSLDRDRCRGLRKALPLSRFFIMDDGFQYYRLKKDLEIVLLDASVPPAACRLLPRGDFREPVTELKRTDIVVFTKISSADPDTFLLLKKAVKAAGISAEKIFGCDFPVEGVFDSKDKKIVPSALKAKKILAFAGIAGFPGFRRSVLSLFPKADVEFKRFSDHHGYSPADLRRLGREKDSGATLVTTEKDAIKLAVALPGLLTIRISCLMHNEKAFLKLLEMSIHRSGRR